MKLERIPHDQFFKRMMSDSRVAKAFFAAHLPEKVKHNILLDSLKMESTSFISRELAHHESDMLYQVKLKNNKVGFIYLLIEHQSRVDELMPFRMLRYIVRIIERYLRQHHNKLPLPLVFPMVFYNGKKPYDGSCELSPLFGDHEELMRDLFLQPFTLIDVSSIEDEAIREHQWAGILEWCMRHTFTRDIKHYINTLGHLFHILNVQNKDDMIESVIRYIIASMSTVDEAKNFMAELYKEIPLTLENEMATIAEKLYYEGKQEGKLESQREMATIAEKLYHEGKLEGKLESQREMATIAEKLFHQGKLKGKLEGKLEGKHEGKTEGIQNTIEAIELITSGADISKIAAKTGINQEMLQLLCNKLAH